VIFIPGPIIALLTFPGVIVHELAHFLFCRLFRLAVFDVCFFRVGNPAGYVLHEPTLRFSAAFFVGLGPFFVNTVLCVVLCLPAFIPVWELQIPDPVSWFFYWLGLSIGMHAFPSSHDLDNIRRLAGPAVKKGNVLALISYPLCGLLYVAGILRFFWADVFYGIAAGVLLPLAVVRWLV
jgi:hypothetical protein